MPVCRTAVIVLNYRGEHILPACLASLSRSVGPEDIILVVDNGNETSLLGRMKGNFPAIEILSLDSNHGFAAGMNAGIRHLLSRETFDAFWLINNDARVQPSSLDELKQAFIEKGDRTLYSPVIFPDDSALRPWFSGGWIDFLRMRTIHEHNLPSGRAPYQTGFLTGCALFIPRATIENIGLLDERYFLYYEDAEYSLRALRKGAALWIAPGSRVVHSEESRQSQTKLYWLVRSGAEFFLRESRGVWRIWIALYYPVRRLKNWLETLAVRGASQTVAKEVKRAYTDVSL